MQASFFPYEDKKLIFPSCVFLPQLWRMESDTVIINPVQAAWRCWLSSWRQQWMGGRMLLDCTANNIDYHSCYFWINLHHPLAIFSIIINLGPTDDGVDWLRVWSISVVLYWFHQEHLTLSPSHHNWLMEEGISPPRPGPPHPQCTWGPWDHIWLKALPNDTLSSG